MVLPSPAAVESAPPGVVPAPAPAEGERAMPFAELYQRHFSFVWRNVRRLVDMDAVVDDLVQDVFLVVVRRLPDFEWRSSPKTWLFGILLNVVREHRRSVRRKGQRQSTDFDAMVDPREGPHASAEKAQALRVVQQLLAQLDDAKREVFVLAELEQMTAPEIVEVTGMPLSTVYSRLRDARREIEAAARRYRAGAERRP